MGNPEVIQLGFLISPCSPPSRPCLRWGFLVLYFSKTQLTSRMKCRVWESPEKEGPWWNNTWLLRSQTGKTTTTKRVCLEVWVPLGMLKDETPPKECKGNNIQTCHGFSKFHLPSFSQVWGNRDQLQSLVLQKLGPVAEKFQGLKSSVAWFGYHLNTNSSQCMQFLISVDPTSKRDPSIPLAILHPSTTGHLQMGPRL